MNTWMTVDPFVCVIWVVAVLPENKKDLTHPATEFELLAAVMSQRRSESQMTA